MSTVTNDATFDVVMEKGDLANGDVSSRVWSLLGTLYPRGDLVERRGEQRYPYPYLVHLTPIAADGFVLECETVVVVGKHLSERGLGFYHPKPLPYRKVIASLESPDGTSLRFLVDLAWCRFTRQGWYESGGRFLAALEEDGELGAF